MCNAYLLLLPSPCHQQLLKVHQLSNQGNAAHRKAKVKVSNIKKVDAGQCQHPLGIKHPSRQAKTAQDRDAYHISHSSIEVEVKKKLDCEG